MLITGLPIDKSHSPEEIILTLRKRLRQIEIIELPSFPFKTLDHLLSIGDKLEKLESQIEKTYNTFVNMMYTKKSKNEDEVFDKRLQTKLEECKSDLKFKLQTFKWIYEVGNVNDVYKLLESKVYKEESVLDERVKNIKELVDEERKLKNERHRRKVRTKKKAEVKKVEQDIISSKDENREKNREDKYSIDEITTASKNTDGLSNLSNSAEVLSNTFSCKDSFIDNQLGSNNRLIKKDEDTMSLLNSQSFAETVSIRDESMNRPTSVSQSVAISDDELQEKHKIILERSLSNMNVKNISDTSKTEITQNKFICNEGESLKDLEIHTEDHEMIKQHYFISHEKQDSESIIKEIPEVCVETLQLHLKTKHERLYSVFGLEKQTDAIIEKLSDNFEYKDTITKEEYEKRVDKMTKLENLLKVTNNNMDLYLSTNYSEVLNIYLHVKFFKVYIESMLHYGIGDLVFFVLENKIEEWRKIIMDWRYSRRLCKNIKDADLFAHTYVGKDDDDDRND